MPRYGVLVSALLFVAVAAGPSGAAVGPAPTPTASPSRGLVIVLRPGDTDERTRTALARVTGELTAARFRVNVVALDPNDDPTHQVETVAPDSNAVAALAIGRPADAGPDIVAIWVCDRLGGRTTIQRMSMQGDSISTDAAALAVEAIELIRVSIAGLWPNLPHAGTLEPPPSTEVAPPTKAAASVERALGFGVAVLRDPNLETSNWLGALSGQVWWPNGLGLRLTLAGLGPADTVQREAGSAAVRHQVASVGVAWMPWKGGRTRLSTALGLGFDYVAARGASPTAALARSESAWTMTVNAGATGAVRLGGGVFLAAEVAVLVATRPLVLTIGTEDTKAVVRPGLLLGVQLLTTF